MHLTLTLTLLFLSTFLSAQNQDIKILRQQNKIKATYTYTYDLETGDSLLMDCNTYNKKGNLLRDIRYNKEGAIRYQYRPTYNKKGLMTKQVGYDESKAISTILVYEYDKNDNRIIYKQLSPEGNILNYQKRRFNKKGQNTHLYNRVPYSNTFVLSSKFYYRKDGQDEKSERFNTRGQLTATSLYQYNEKNLLIATYQLVDGDSTLISTNTYNAQQQLLELAYPRKVEKIENEKLVTIDTSTKTQYGYDQEGNLIEERIFEGGQLIKQKKYFFKKFR
ncbi:MAG: hypothetical protein ACRBFS_18270 [Aureispira sp.]